MTEGTVASQMVERVARAIYDTMPVGVREWPDAPEYTRLRCLTCARAAIGAMREPTEAMINAGLAEEEVDLASEYRAMIAAALAEETL